mgnify:CR=1 FL=1
MPELKHGPRAEHGAIDKERSRIVLACVLALAFLIVTFFLFRPPTAAVVVVAVIVLVGLKKAAVRYQALGRAKTDL